MPATVAQLVNTIRRSGGTAQTRAAARLMSLLENEPARLPELFLEEGPLQDALPASSTQASSPKPQACTALVLGVTGSPGAGKSTLTDALLSAFRRRRPEARVGVIAVDPSSPFTGGAVLGDRVRMMRHATDPQVFVRSLASRGHLGGLSLGVRGVLHVMGLLGCELVIIETVGVGQSEVEVASVADLTLIVFAPGQGDSIQLLKAGLMEIGDLFVINKADRAGADELHGQLMAVLKLGSIDEHCGHHHGVGLPAEHAHEEVKPSAELGLMRSSAGHQKPSVHLVSSLEKRGIEELLAELDQRAAAHGEQWRRRRAQAVADEIREAVLEKARQRVDQALGRNGTLGGQLQRVLAGQVSIAALAQELLRKAGQDHEEHHG